MDGPGLHRAFARRITVALALCLGLTLFPAVAAADEIEWMYDPDAVVEIHLGGLSEEELDALEAEPDEEQKGTFELTVDGEAKGVPLADVGIRLKGGAGSSRPIKTGKSGLKIRFDKFVKGQLFFGVKRLTLNNMIQDPSMVHEALTYEMFHEMGLPASRVGYAFVTLNGEEYGLFLNLETLDEVSLPRWFGETTRHLFEADAPKTDLLPGHAEKFEVDEGEEDDLADLEALIAAVNEEDGEWFENVAAAADLERMTAQWAIERYVAHWDGYAGLPGEFRPNNYYLHSDTDGVFQMMPWGTDQTWVLEDIAFEHPAGGIMFNECLQDSNCLELYVESLTSLHCVDRDLDQGAHAARRAAMLLPYQGKEDEEKRETSPEEISEAVEDVETFAAARAEQLVEYLIEERVLGVGPDPCAPPTEPGPKQPHSPAPLTAAPGPKLSIGPSRARGSFVATRLFVPAAADATQRVTARLGGRRVQVCADRGSRPAAGPLRLRCRLSPPVREALEEGPLELRIRIDYRPAVGKSRSVVRSLTVPKRS